MGFDGEEVCERLTGWACVSSLYVTSALLFLPFLSKFGPGVSGVGVGKSGTEQRGPLLSLEFRHAGHDLIWNTQVDMLTGDTAS